MSSVHEPPGQAADQAVPRQRVRRLADLVAPVLAGAPTLGRARLVCIDGPAGSGKTTLAGRLAAVGRELTAEPVTIVHMDDLYRGWDGLEHAVQQVVPAGLLRPLAAGQPGCYRRYDWATERYAEPHSVPADVLLVLEGCGSAARSVDGLAGLRIWVQAPSALRLRRGLARDGDAARPQWLAWRRAEARHFRVERTAARADVWVAGEPSLPHDADTEVVELVAGRAS